MREGEAKYTGDNYPAENYDFLSIKDARELEEQGTVIVRQFLKDYPQELPDAIILPDTSARPLFYFLKPILDKTSKERGVVKSKIYFFKTNRFISEALNEPHNKEAQELYDSGQWSQKKAKCEEEKYGEAEWKLSELLRQKKLTPDESKQIKEKIRIELEKQYVFNALGDIIRNMNKIKFPLQVLRNRANEIRKHINKTNPKLIIFDDIIAGGDTLTSINTAFGEKIPAYAFKGMYNRDYYAEQNNLDIHVGFSTGEGQGYYVPKINFDYRHSSAIGVKKEETGNASYAELLETMDISTKRDMGYLRSDMKKIGEEVIENLKYD